MLTVTQIQKFKHTKLTIINEVKVLFIDHLVIFLHFLVEYSAYMIFLMMNYRQAFIQAG